MDKYLKNSILVQTLTDIHNFYLVYFNFLVYSDLHGRLYNGNQEKYEYWNIIKTLS